MENSFFVSLTIKYGKKVKSVVYLLFSPIESLALSNTHSSVHGASLANLPVMISNNGRID